jgi:hypothetical protein
MSIKLFAAVAFLALSTTAAFAQESEFQAKMKEDVGAYAKKLTNQCGSTGVTVEWEGKLGSNPREGAKPGLFGLSTLCTSALDAIVHVCLNNAPSKKEIAKVKKVVCKMGKGTLAYKLSGSSLEMLVDNSFTADNPSSQEDNLIEKLKKELDK